MNSETQKVIDQQQTPQRATWRSWLVWSIGAIYVMFQFMIQSSPSVMREPIMKEFSLAETATAILSSSYFWTYLVLQIPSGMLVDRIGARRLLFGATLFCIFGLLIFASASSFTMAIAGRMMVGISLAPAVVSSFYLAANWFPPRHFAFVVGLTETLAMIGGALGSGALAYIITGWGWRYSLVLCAIIAFLIFIANFFIVKDKPKAALKTNSEIKANIYHQTLQVIRYPQVWLCGIYSGLVFVIISVLASYWMIPYLVTRFHISTEIAAHGAEVIFLGAAIGNPIIGHLSDYWAKRRPLMAIGTIITLLLLAAVFYLPGLKFFNVMLLLFLAGLMCTVYMLPFAVVSEMTSAEVRGTAMGFTNMLNILIGAPLLQPLIAVILEREWDGKIIDGIHIFTLSDYTMAFSTIILCLIVGLILLFFVNEKYCLTRDELSDEE